MKILHVIDSLEINGGSMMCFELASAMRRHFTDCDVNAVVVSKTGKYGRKNILANEFASAYGWPMPSMDYKRFYDGFDKYSDWVIIHHRLECTKPLSFKNRPRLYLVVNHTIQKPHRLKKFENADVFVSVCKFLKNHAPKLKQPHHVILNGISKNTHDPLFSNGFVSGRCHRLPSSKFSVKSLKFLDSLKISNHIHYLVGPDGSEASRYCQKHQSTCIRYLKKVDNYDYKRSLIRTFDIYFYDTYGPEGASVAILEGLAAGVPVLCKASGGNTELVKHGINGFHYNTLNEAKDIILMLYHDKDMLKQIKESTSADFDQRLSIERCVKEYRDLMNYRRAKDPAVSPLIDCSIEHAS